MFTVTVYKVATYPFRFSFQKRAAATAPKSPVAASGVENDRQRAAREKREAARNKLREMKAAAKRAREGEGEGADTEGELVIELPKSPKTKRSKEGKHVCVVIHLCNGGGGVKVGTKWKICMETYMFLRFYVKIYIYMKAQKHARFHVFSPISASFYPSLHHLIVLKLEMGCIIQCITL